MPHAMRLLNKVPRLLRVPECPSARRPITRVHNCQSVLSAQVPKCSLSAPGIQALKCASALSARVPGGPFLQCPKSLSALRVTLEWPLSTLPARNVYNITENGFLNSFIEFFRNFSVYVFYISFIAFPDAIIQRSLKFFP